MDAILELKLDKEPFERKETTKGSFIVLENRYFTHIRNKLANGKNWVCIFTGRTRSGKSFSSLRICEVIDPNFNIDNVVFSAKEFMALIKSGKLKSGSMILWDEAGVGIATREWYSVLNKSVNLIFQTWGYRNIGLLLTVPHISFVDSQTRKLCHAHIQTLKLSMKRKVVTAKIHNLTPLGADDIKRVRPRYDMNGRILDVEYLEIRKPSAKLVHAYEKKKQEFSEKLSNTVQLELQNNEDRQKEGDVKLISDKDMLTQAWDKLKDTIILVNGKRKIGLYQIRKTLNITVDRAKFVQQNVLLKSEELNYPEFNKIDIPRPELNTDLL